MKKLLVLLLISLFWTNSAYALKLFGGLIHIDDDLLEAPKMQTQKPWEKKSAKSQSRSGKSGIDTISFRSSRDVDIVAGRIKREFGYKTRQQVLDSRDGEWKIHATSFRYDVQPGAYYEMAGPVLHRYNGRTVETGIMVLIEREGSGSQIEFTFKSGDEGLGPRLVARAKRAIRR